MENVTFILAFAGGFLAFISPCCLPLYPSFISYITGVSVSELKENKDTSIKKNILLHSLFFCIGLSIVYYILGFSMSTIGILFASYQKALTMFGGIFLVVMGLFLTGIYQPKFMLKAFQLQRNKKSASFFNSMFVGFIFSAGWTPCIGPIFAAIMYNNVLNPAATLINVTAYSLGFCIPFILMGFFLGRLKFITKYSAILTKVGGFIIIVLGLMIYFDKMIYLNIWTSHIEYLIKSWL
ncbi:cytochrome c biogenesis CcdA family protein [Sutcliffiella horikoshii]|uniref:cytochrome c biogenesis CcdA family protein n=1 Tax=Sutcliffiella horikoshii TaxID=79883 RepID=UPI001FD1FCA2|nr:cytochrome c biogenesis protein CcdA [Sutcliffiella horikoshii]